MPRWSHSLALAVAALCTAPLVAGCDAAECTLADCNHQAVVTYPSGLVAGPYDLILAWAGQTPLSARCADPGAPELADNPAELTCDLSGFELVGEQASMRTVTVTVTDVESGDVIVANAEVRLEAVDELRPNGPDCEPVCFVRNGQLIVGAPQ